jgi:hypothetical protein
MGFGYPFPELRIQDVGKVVTEDDRIVMAALGVPIIECYLLVSPNSGTPGERLLNLKALHAAIRAELKERGYQWGQSDIPPEIEKSFGKRLKKLGWFKSEWPSWAVQI